MVFGSCFSLKSHALRQNTQTVMPITLETILPITLIHLMLQEVNILLRGLIWINKRQPHPVSFLTWLKYHCDCLHLVTKVQAKALTA